MISLRSALEGVRLREWNDLLEYLAGRLLLGPGALANIFIMSFGTAVSCLED
jgi:hypothetical protein